MHWISVQAYSMLERFWTSSSLLSVWRRFILKAGCASGCRWPCGVRSGSGGVRVDQVCCRRSFASVEVLALSLPNLIATHVSLGSSESGMCHTASSVPPVVLDYFPGKIYLVLGASFFSSVHSGSRYIATLPMATYPCFRLWVLLVPLRYGVWIPISGKS